MARPSKLARAQSHQGGANAPSSGSAGPTQPSGETEQPSPFDFLNYVPSSVTEHDARPLPAPGPPPAPQSTGDTGMFDFLDHIPSSILGPTQDSQWDPHVPFQLWSFRLDRQPPLQVLAVALSVITAGSAPGQQGVCTPSTASSAHASAPRAMPVPTAATRGVKRHTNASHLMSSASLGLMASAMPGAMSSSAPIIAAQPAQHPAPYDFLQHIPASQRMAHDRTTSLVHTNMEVDEDPQPPVADDVGP
ncbi:hypothetical protein EI94DRAFT_1704025 [Lactarius quietus]|nr:hypothetical protein EI94DRAFT_1704025 [Lactarius quietus]